MNKEENYRIYLFLVLLTIAAYTAFQGWSTLFNNYAVDTAGLDSFRVGLIQSAREVPGFFVFLTVFLLLIFKEKHLASLSVLVLGAGIALTGLFSSSFGLLISTVIMSTGLHLFETTNRSLTLQYFSHDKAPKVFGKFRSFAAIANISVGIFIWVFSSLVSTSVLFFIIGTAVTLAALFSFFFKTETNNLEKQNNRFVIKRKYSLFYILNFFAGARRQIFVVFAVFLLVKKYNYSIPAITTLFIINNIINFFFAPLIADAITRFGEKKILSAEYFSLILIFLAYAFIENDKIIAVLYILDHIFFNFAIAINTYFQKFGDREDIAPSMAVGFAINHITAVFIPFIGGYIWLYNWRVPFIAGSVLSLLSLIFVQFISLNKQKT